MNNKVLNCEIDTLNLKNQLSSQLFITTSSKRATGNVPLERSGHVACLIEKQDVVFIQGGSNKSIDHSDSYLYNIQLNQWEKVGIQLKAPEQLSFVGHKCTTFPSFEHCASNVMLFGGWNGERYSNQITLVNLQNRQVRQSIQTESEPKQDTNALKNTKSTLDGKNLMKVDSALALNAMIQAPASLNNDEPNSTGNTNSNNNLSSNNTNNGSNINSNISNRVVVSQKQPPSVRDHTLVYDFTKNSVLLFGGWDAMKFEFGSNEYNSLWILDSKWNWFNVKTSGQIPLGRRGHTCVFLQSPYGLVLFGGLHGYNKIVNDCYFLDLNTFEWRQIFERGNMYFPSPRAFHSANRLHDKIIYYGGLLKKNQISNQIIVHDLSLDEWTEVSAGINFVQSIPPLMMHSAVYTDNDEILLMGGMSDDPENTRNQKTQALDIVYVIKLEFIDSSLIQQSPSPKRQLKEEQLHWNMMAFPALEALPSESIEEDNSQKESLELIQSAQVEADYAEPIFFLESNDMDSFYDLESKFFSKIPRKKYHLSQVIEESSKVMKDSVGGGESLNEEEQHSDEEEYTWPERKKDFTNANTKGEDAYDPFENFPQEETEDNNNTNNNTKVQSAQQQQ